MKKHDDEQTIADEKIKFSFFIIPSESKPNDSNPKNVPIQPMYIM
jgi:hypothetical protein